MRSRIAARRMLAAVAAVAMLVGTASPTRAEPREWDQKKVAHLVNQVLTAVSYMKKAVAAEWDRADKTSARYIVLNDLMIVHHRLVALLGLVRSGEGREKTEPVYRRVKTAVGHARRDANTFPVLEEQQSRIDAAEAALAQLAEFYEG